jgi:hypothetical protein
MDQEADYRWGMNQLPPLEGSPFALARSSCLHAVQVAQDVFIDELALQRFVVELDTGAIHNLPHGSLGENLHTVSGDFRHADDAANFAVLFCLLQFGHGFRHALHQHCGRGASQTITLGVRALHGGGDLSAARLCRLTLLEIHQAFALPQAPGLATFVQQLEAVLHQAGTVLERLGLQNFAAFCQRVLEMPAATETPAAVLVQQLAHHFPAFNDQGVLHDGSRVVLLKKATLTVGELRRLAAPYDARYCFFQDYEQAVAPVDNVIPASKRRSHTRDNRRAGMCSGIYSRACATGVASLTKMKTDPRS